MTPQRQSPQSVEPAAGTRLRVGHAVAAHRSLLGVAAALVGAVVGAAAVVFNLAIRAWTWVSTGFDEYTTHVGQPHGVWGWTPWLFLLLSPAIAGLLYGPLIQRFAPSAKGHGIPEVMLAVRRKGGRIPGRVAIVKILASALTIGSGGSAGREGPIVQVGASLGSTIASWLRMPVSRVVLLASCGSAAGIAATFHAPLAGAVFALEVILVEFTAETFGFVVLSAVTSSVVARILQGDEMVIRVADNLTFASMSDIWWVALLGLVAGLCGLGFSKLLYASEDAIDWLWARTHLPEWARPGVLGLALGAALVAFPYMFGSGYPLEEDAIAGSYSIAFLLALMLGRAVFTSFTIGMGGSGGVFAPTLFIGAMAGAAFGDVISPLSDSPVGVFAVVGMGAAFAGAARAPMTAVLIIVEMTGQFSLILPMMLAVVIATGASRFLTRATIYTEKLRRRGDVLDDPVEGTLLGTRAASEWMTEAPETLPCEASAASAIAALRRTKETVLPVVNDDRRFIGLVSSLRLAELTQEDGSLDAPLSDLPLIDEAVAASAPPSEVLGALRSTGLQSLPVVDADRRVVGWVSERDLVDRMYRDQRRAIEARTQTSWGSRMQERRRSR